MLSPQEYQHYQRHITLPQLGLVGQTKLKNAKVLVIGAGGLSCPMLLYLAAAGVGKIGIMDGDTIDISNLHRQILYDIESVGKLKVAEAQRKLLLLNPHITIETYPFFCKAENALPIFAEYDVIADGSDNFATRYLTNDAAVLTEKPLVYAAIHQFQGQVAVFNFRNEKSFFSSNYRDLFPSPPLPDSVPNCAEAGVLGVLPGIIGSIQALEVIKIITGIGEILADKLFIFDTLSFSQYTLNIQKEENNPLTGKNPTQTQLIDYELFCNSSPTLSKPIREISVETFLAWKNAQKPFQLIDVREKEEYEKKNIGGISVPFSIFEKNIPIFAANLPIVIHCQTGKRSAKAVAMLQEKYGFEEVWNLCGFTQIHTDDSR